MSDFEKTSSQQPFSESGGPSASGGHGGEEWGVAQELDPLASGSTAKKSRKGALVLIIVVGLAAGSLFSLHTLTEVTAAQGRDSDIERIVDGFLNSVSGGGSGGTDGGDALVDEHNEVVQVLTDNYTDNQVKQLQKDPFTPAGGAVEVQESDDGDFDRARRRDEFERAAEKLLLKSVIQGARPMAIVNGRIVRLNQTIPMQLRGGDAVEFKVTSITGDSITVVAEDPEFELRVEKVIGLDRDY